MKRAKARVRQLRTADRLMGFKDHVQVGDLYWVDLDSRDVSIFWNMDFEVAHSKEVVEDVINGGPLPTELLEIEEVK